MVALRHEDAQPRARRTRLRLRLLPPRDAPLALVRRDTLPEHADYRDTGCGASPSCLRCPLVRCKYDEPPVRNPGAAARDREIALIRHRHGAPIRMLAQTYGLTNRTIFRILSEQAAPATAGAESKGAHA
jgi:hypothetical protein